MKARNILGIRKVVVESEWGLGQAARRAAVYGPTRTRTWDRPIMSRML